VRVLLLVLHDHHSRLRRLTSGDNNVCVMM
jgi:hypothetical protein